MQYVGGKFRQRRHFVPAILENTPNRVSYLEPFVGGGSMLEKMGPHFQSVVAGDIHEDLILMWEAARTGWVPPTSLDEATYQTLRDSEPSALRGFVGFGCSFGGKWFGGYARDSQGFVGESPYPRRSSNAVVKNVSALPPDTTFVLRGYHEHDPAPGTVVYADPPYATRGVEYRDSIGFDHQKFWSVMDDWVESGVHVFVSEFNAPDHWVSLVNSVQRLTIAGNSPISKAEQGLQHDRLWVPEKYRFGYGDVDPELYNLI